MKTYEIAPGSILQRIYLKERLKEIGEKGKFLEVGAGTGHVSNLLLSCGYRGVAFDLNDESCNANRELNQAYISKGLFEVRNDDFLELNPEEKYDIIISCMVIEHLDESDLERYFSKCADLLSDKGRIISLVPASMKYWSIEDEIAGHYKRYTFDCFDKIAQEFSFSINRCDGLTFPVSNLLFPISNLLVKRSESQKLGLSKQKQTLLSSNRKVLMKTDFPNIFRLFLNEITLFPFHLLQKGFRKHKDSMVIYCEMVFKNVSNTKSKTVN